MAAARNRLILSTWNSYFGIRIYCCSVQPAVITQRINNRNHHKLFTEIRLWLLKLNFLFLLLDGSAKLCNKNIKSVLHTASLTSTKIDYIIDFVNEDSN